LLKASEAAEPLTCEYFQCILDFKLSGSHSHFWKALTSGFWDRAWFSLL